MQRRQLRNPPSPPYQGGKKDLPLTRGTQGVNNDRLLKKPLHVIARSDFATKQSTNMQRDCFTSFAMTTSGLSSLSTRVRNDSKPSFSTDC